MTIASTSGSSRISDTSAVTLTGDRRPRRGPAAPLPGLRGPAAEQGPGRPLGGVAEPVELEVVRCEEVADEVAAPIAGADNGRADQWFGHGVPPTGTETGSVLERSDVGDRSSSRRASSSARLRAR